MPKGEASPGDFSWASELNETEWLEFLTGTRRIEPHRCPPLPPGEVQRTFVGSAGMAAFQEAALFLSRVKQIVSAAGNPLKPSSKVLDFGVGWGRLYRILLREIQLERLIGVDLNIKAIEMCKQAMPYGSFFQIPAGPPYSFQAGEFDLIILYSVFSHLSEALFRAVTTEFGRLLKSGAFVAFTTLKRAHLDVWARQADEPYLRSHLDRRAHLERADFEISEWRRRIDAGEFLFVQTGGGDPLRPLDFYGEAIVTEAFLRGTLNPAQFQIVHFSESDDAPQSIVVLQRV